MTEATFVDTFINSTSARRHLLRDGVVYEQLETPRGIPDLVLVPKKQQVILKRFVKKYGSTLMNGQARVVSTLTHHKGKDGLTENFLLHETGLTKGYFRQIARQLSLNGIVENDDNFFTLRNDFAIPHIDVTVLEFKLSDWKRALRQSLRYRCLSSNVIVVMPYERKGLLESKRSVFRKFNIGLALFDHLNDSLKFIQKAPLRKRLSEDYIDILARLTSARAI